MLRHCCSGTSASYSRASANASTFKPYAWLRIAGPWAVAESRRASLAGMLWRAMCQAQIRNSYRTPWAPAIAGRDVAGDPAAAGISVIRTKAPIPVSFQAFRLELPGIAAASSGAGRFAAGYFRKIIIALSLKITQGLRPLFAEAPPQPLNPFRPGRGYRRRSAL